jgi:hypothetical protein
MHKNLSHLQNRACAPIVLPADVDALQVARRAFSKPGGQLRQ